MSAPGSTPFSSKKKKVMVIKEPPHGLGFKCGKASHWGKICPCLDCRQYVQIVNKQGTGKSTARLFPNQSFIIPASQKTLSSILGMETKDWMSQWHQNTLSDCPGSQQPLSFTISRQFQSPKAKVSSEIQGNLLTVTSCKIKKQITFFKHAVAQYIHYYS